MNFRRALCWIGKHDLTGWQTVRATPLTADTVRELLILTPPYRKRKCKRCGKVETKPLRPRRAANLSDTIQFVPLSPPKE